MDGKCVHRLPQRVLVVVSLSMIYVHSESFKLSKLAYVILCRTRIWRSSFCMEVVLRWEMSLHVKLHRKCMANCLKFLDGPICCSNLSIVVAVCKSVPAVNQQKYPHLSLSPGGAPAFFSRQFLVSKFLAKSRGFVFPAHQKNDKITCSILRIFFTQN